MKDREILDLITKRVYNEDRPEKEQFFEHLQHYEADDTLTDEDTDRRSTMIGRILESQKPIREEKTWEDWVKEDNEKT